MTVTNANSIIELYFKGNLSLKNAAEKLWIEIYENPANYGLSILSEDQISDFLIDVSKRFSAIIKNYKNGIIDFQTYIKACLKHGMQSWLRKELKKYAGENCLNENFFIEYQEIYEQDEPKLTCKENFSIDETPLSDLSEKKQEMAQYLIYLLACRACNEIDDEMIEKIAQFIKKDPVKLKQEIYTLRRETQNKKEKRSKAIKKRNRAFYFHKKFSYEMLHIDPQSASYDFLKERYEKHTKAWEKSNFQLQHRFSIYPSNREISEIAGMSQRKVAFYLNHQSKRKDLLPFIDFPSVKDE